MITDKQWYQAKHGNTPPFTAQIRRQERHCGKPVEVRRGWLRRNYGYVMFLLSGFGAVVCFAALLLLTLHLLPNAIEAEIDRQVSVVEQQVKGVMR